MCSSPNTHTIYLRFSLCYWRCHWVFILFLCYISDLINCYTSHLISIIKKCHPSQYNHQVHHAVNPCSSVQPSHKSRLWSFIPWNKTLWKSFYTAFFVQIYFNGTFKINTDTETPHKEIFSFMNVMLPTLVGQFPTFYGTWREIPVFRGVPPTHFCHEPNKPSPNPSNCIYWQ